ncbi:MAG: hypothetical protein ACAH95_09560 [Fimbriimonas sp.]
MLPFCLVAALATTERAIEVFTPTYGIRVLRQGQEFVEELYAVDGKGNRRLVLVSPSHKVLAGPAPALTTNLLQGTQDGLFQRPPTFAFDQVRVEGNCIILGKQSGDWKVEKRVTAIGEGFDVQIGATTNAPYPQIRYLLCTYAFAPDGMKMSAYGKPDSTWAPGLRPGDQNVVGDHFFRAPAVVAQKGSLAATLMPDLYTLSDNRPIPTIIDLDCKNGVVDAPLMSYGFSDYRLTGHVYFASDASMVQPVPWDLQLKMKVLVDAKAEPMAAYRKAPEFLWKRYGHGYFDKVLPQAMPFADYARVCYPAAFNEKATGGWFEHEINGFVCGGMPSGWGLYDGWVSWQDWFNQLRSAWGVRWWGKKLGEKDWVDKADKMLNLALAAPMDRGAVPTTYLSRTKSWKGTLISPSPDCYYDLTNMAWKGLWMMKWLEFPDCPRRDEIERQLQAMAEMMFRFQNKDGSFPTWLTKEHKVVPILDRSAQSALPTWFLAEYLLGEHDRLAKIVEALRLRIQRNENVGEIRPQIIALEARLKTIQDGPNLVAKAGRFLAAEIVPKQRYYDFETFFSCSPKQCLQRNGVIDDLKMWDHHTMQAPQNTLCMQWTAEALKVIASPEFDDLFDRVMVSQTKSSAKLPVGMKYLSSGRALTPNASRLAPSLMALDIMALYQNVWPISYRKAAYTYGGFGVQNSDGEYNDARQAQFGSTLCHFGAQLGRQDYFERGVAAIRASLTLINHPLHEQLGLYPNPNYPLGLQPENTGHGGTDQQNGRTGFDWGEGSGLASAAEIMDKYGSEYQHPSGWKVIVDGRLPEDNFPSGALSLTDPTFDFTNWRLPGWTFAGNFLTWPTRSTRYNFNAGGKPFIGTCEDGKGGFDDEYVGTITSPWFTITKPTIKLLVGGGAGPGVYAELEDHYGSKRLAIERGRNTETMDERTWDVSAYKRHLVRIRIVDNEKGGWGHINVGNIRIE